MEDLQNKGVKRQWVEKRGDFRIPRGEVEIEISSFKIQKMAHKNTQNFKKKIILLFKQRILG